MSLPFLESDTIAGMKCAQIKYLLDLKPNFKVFMAAEECFLGLMLIAIKRSKRIFFSYSKIFILIVKESSSVNN